MTARKTKTIPQIMRVGTDKGTTLKAINPTVPRAKRRFPTCALRIHWRILVFLVVFNIIYPDIQYVFWVFYFHTSET